MENKKKKQARLVILLSVFLCVAFFTILMVWNKVKDSGVQSFTNRGNTYRIILDKYVVFQDTTSTSPVNNVDGLEVNYRDTYISIQRFPIKGNMQSNWTVENFRDFVDGKDRFDSTVKEAYFYIKNKAVKESLIYNIYMNDQNTMYYGVLYYFKTDSAFYKVLLSGSDKKCIDHYRYFIDDMEFME